MKFEDFQKQTAFSFDDLIAYSQGTLIDGAPAGLPALPGSLLLPFHEITRLSWDAASGAGRIEAVRRNRVDEWFYACHFLGDPVMPGCWGIDAVWQALKFFAAWRGIARCDKALAMDNVSFFGQIRPYDQKIVYAVDVLSIEESDGETLVTGKAAVSVDGMPVYTIASAQVATTFWETDPAARPSAALPAPDRSVSRHLSCDEFSARDRLSHAEVLALSQGTLIEPSSSEIGLLPCSLMLEIGRIERISFDEATGEGRIIATRPNSALEWFYAMNRGGKPTALTIDAVWQLLGLFLTWRQNAGTGRALGFEKVEVFDDIRPTDQEIVCEEHILKMTRAEGAAGAFARADAKVFADGRLVLACTNASVGCHKNIRYSDYPQLTDMATGGKLKTARKSEYA